MSDKKEVRVFYLALAEQYTVTTPQWVKKMFSELYYEILSLVFRGKNYLQRETLIHPFVPTLCVFF